MYDDDMPFDESELAEAYGEDELTAEDAFTMVTLNTKRKIKVNVSLVDQNNNEVSMPETVEGILSYIDAQSKDEGAIANQFVSQIVPLMSQAMSNGLVKSMGTQTAAILLSNDTIKHSIIDMMCLSFLLLKFVQKNNLKINTYEESISDEEIESIFRKTKLNKVATMSALSGLDPKEMLAQLVESGDITQEEFEEMFNKKKV